MGQEMILRTRRLILRGWRDEDAPSLFKYAKDERIGPIAGWLPHQSVAYSRAVIRTVFAGRETYAICLKDRAEEPIGSIGLTLEGSPERPLGEAEAELGYWVAVPYWGRGIATEASREVLRHAFEDLDIDRVFCGYFDGNTRSEAVQLKCGFSFHHTNEKSPVPMLREVRVEHINVLTRSDWNRGTAY